MRPECIRIKQIRAEDDMKYRADNDGAHEEIHRDGPGSANNSSRKVFFLLLVCCAGVCYLIWIRCGGPAIPCPFHLLTGLDCPGCGITRLLAALSRGDLQEAAHANAYLFYTLPYLVMLIAYTLLKWFKNERTGRWFEAAALLYAAGLVLFGIWRNIPHLQALLS